MLLECPTSILGCHDRCCFHVEPFFFIVDTNYRVTVFFLFYFLINRTIDHLNDFLVIDCKMVS
jgi:hypothetical protein